MFSRPGVLLVPVLGYAPVRTVDAFAFFQDRIPNGRHVVLNGIAWHAVGHFAPRGSNVACFGPFELNPFGRDFADEGFAWTKRLCLLDSDYDGVPNGLELGDPHCEWTEDDHDGTKQLSEVRGHPGISDRTDRIHAGGDVNFAWRELRLQVGLLQEGDEVVTNYTSQIGIRRHQGRHVRQLAHAARAKVLRVAGDGLDPGFVEVQIHSSKDVFSAPRAWVRKAKSGGTFFNRVAVLDTAAEPIHNLTDFEYPLAYRPPIDLEVTGASANETQGRAWFAQNLGIASCGRTVPHEHLNLPVGKGVFVFVNVVIPLWLAFSWYDAKRRNSWQGVNMWLVWAMVVLITQVGISAGFHRYFAHRSYKAAWFIVCALALVGQLAMQGDAMYWAAMHRTHHRRCDAIGDPHSPHVDNFFHSHGGFVWNDGSYDFLYRDITPDLTKSSTTSWIAYQSIFSLIGLPVISHLLFGKRRTLFYLHLPQFLAWHVTELINSACHLWGYVSYARDAMSEPCVSRNSPWLASLVWGEVWHNNHHAAPSSCAFGRRWWELDPAYILLRVLERLGLVWDLSEYSPPGAADASSHEAMKVCVSCILLCGCLSVLNRALGGSPSPRRKKVEEGEGAAVDVEVEEGARAPFVDQPPIVQFFNRYVASVGRKIRVVPGEHFA